MQISTGLKDFQVLTKLGQGAFGQVFKVKRKADSQIYAMKKIKLSLMKQKQRQNALNQVRILASYNGQYIIGYKQSFFDEVSSTLCIIMQFAGSGDILKMVQTHIKNKTKFSESQIWKTIVHITQGLRSLHQKKILHRDLKCANVFVTSDGIYKLGDLNVSKVLKKDLAQTQTGTPYYASPEVWKDKPYGAKSDMWSLGCVLYQMCALRPPFTATDLSGLYKKICAGLFNRIPANYSNDLAKLISSLLKLNPSQRPNTIELLENPMVHKNYIGTIDVQPKQKQQKDFLLQTLKFKNNNLKSIKNILPKANYDGLLKSSRKNSLQRIHTQGNKQVNAEFEKQTPKKLQKSQSSKQLSQKKQKQQKQIENYLQMKKRHQQKQRLRMLQQLKNQKDVLIKKRQRVLSACGMRNHSENSANSPKNKVELNKNIQGDVTPKIQKNDSNLVLPPTNKNLPPKPALNNNIVNYKLPPKPNNHMQGKQNNSIDYSRQQRSRERMSQKEASSARDKSKENLVRAAQNVLNPDNLKSPKASQNRGARSNSAQKVIYPSWWLG